MQWIAFILILWLLLFTAARCDLQRAIDHTATAPSPKASPS